MIVCLAGDLQAQEHHTGAPHLWLELPPCLIGDHRAIERTVVAELGAVLDRSETPSVTRVRVACISEALQIGVWDPNTAKATSRQVFPGQEDPRARDRLVALAIAELVHSSWSELATNPRPTITKPASSPLAPMPMAVERRSFFPLSVKLEAMQMRNGPLLWGAAGRLQLLHESGWGTAYEGGLAMGQQDFDSGTSKALLAQAATGISWMQSQGNVTITTEAGGRFGFARLSGATNVASIEPLVLQGLWGGPRVESTLRWSNSRTRWAPSLGVELGYGLWGLQGRVFNADAIAFRGPWVGVCLGIGRRSQK